MEAPRGQITAITGRNRIGKTTIALALSGLMRFQSGCVRINGVKIVQPETAAAGLFLLQ